MRESTPIRPGLSPVCGKGLEARFDGGSLSSDFGVLALREVEQRLGIADRLAACLPDWRMPERVRHSLADLLRFRLLMIACGDEDGHDADSLRSDPAFKLACERLPDGVDLCSQSTLSRLENMPDMRVLLPLQTQLLGSRGRCLLRRPSQASKINGLRRPPIRTSRRGTRSASIGQMKGFRSARQVQRFLSIHDPIANLFHLPRHRLSASTYRAARVQAFAAWAEMTDASLAA